MKFLRNIPALLKRHYEKVILALALIGLIGAVVYLNEMKSAENEKIESYNRGITKRKGKPIPTVDASALATALAHATNPVSLSFSPPHNLMNPVKWQRRPDGTLIKVETGREIGPAAMELVKIETLRLVISLDKPSGAGFLMSVVNEGATNIYLRRKFQSYVTTNSTSRSDRTKTFTLQEVKGTAEAPVVVVDLNDGTHTEISADKPFSRVVGYKADMNYPPEKISFPDRRVGDQLTLAGEDYIIVAITPNEVVFSARSNDRRTIIRNNAAQP